MTPIYLDFNASTRIDSTVEAAMRPLLEHGYGNRSTLPPSISGLSSPRPRHPMECRGEVLRWTPSAGQKPG
jgi:hypothetical protein